MCSFASRSSFSRHIRCCGIFFFFSIASAYADVQTLYLETFPRSSDQTSTFSGQISGWKGIKGGRTIGTSTVLKIHPPGSATKEKSVNSFPIGDQEGHAFWGQPTGSGLILYTTETSLPVKQLQTVSYQQRTDGYDVKSGRDSTRLALLISSSWYISDQSAQQAKRGDWESVKFDVASLTFGKVKHHPCSAPTVPNNSGFLLPTSGLIKAFGVFMNSAHGRVRLDNFALSGSDSDSSLPSVNSPGNDDCPLGVWDSLFAFDPYAHDDEKDECNLADVASCDLDSDEDGLQDWQERSLGTRLDNPDSDGDGIKDGDEVILGTSPVDRGSRVRIEESISCLPWNTYFGMWNISEHSAAFGVPFVNTTQVSDLSGASLGGLHFKLSPFEQRDILVHDIVARGKVGESYGLLCSSTDGPSGALRATMVQYKPVPYNPSSERTFQFAFANQDTTGRTGVQILPFNTYSPSSLPASTSQLTANWITVVNRGASGKRSYRAKLRFFNSRGELLGEEQVLTRGAERRDVAGGHQYGAQQVGLVEFIPEGAEDSYQVNLARYVFRGNQSKSDEILAAVQIPAMLGSGEKQLLPLDIQNDSMTVIELLNVSEQAIVADVTILTLSGVVKSHPKVKLLRKATVHLIVDAILAGERGFALIQGSASIQSSAVNSLAALSMHYKRSSEGNIHSMFGVSAQEPVGFLHLMSFNSFLGQENELWGLSIADSLLTAKLRIRLYSGEIVSSSLTVPSLGAVAFTARVPADTYGTVAITTSPRKTAWWLLRKHKDFVLPLSGTQ